MSWKCYSCETENSNEDALCKNCGNTVAAPKSFYAHWIFGAAIFFMIFYMVAVMAGGVIVEAVATPSAETILAEHNSTLKKGVKPVNSLLKLESDQLTSAKANSIKKQKAKIPAYLQGMIKWFLPVLLFIICGAIVGFISDGVTIYEAGLGSALGQVFAGSLMMYGFGSDSVTWIHIGIGILPGAGLALFGAWLGEIIQDKKERAGGITA